MKYVAFTTKGLEGVAVKELESLRDTSILEEKDKRIIFQTEASIDLLVKLKTIDDIGIYLAKVDSLTDLNQIIEDIRQVDLYVIKKNLEGFRNVRKEYSITISTAGSLLNPKELIKTTRNYIEEKYKWVYTELDHSNFDIRIFVDHKEALLSIRLTSESLHNRSYKVASKPGSLKPTIAAGMLALATDFKNSLKIVDNFCGSGTILCEGVLSGNEVYGGDIDPESVEITKSNLSNLDYIGENKIKVLNAAKTSWPNHFFDCAVSNFPWDKQIEVTSITNLYEGTIKEYARILKPDGVLCVLVSKPELFIKYVKKYFYNRDIKQLKIGLLGQTPTIIVVR